jgi:hypothetical protein
MTHKSVIQPLALEHMYGYAGASAKSGRLPVARSNLQISYHKLAHRVKLLLCPMLLQQFDDVGISCFLSQS